MDTISELNDDGLSCCEYSDVYNKKHLLECLCNCEDFHIVFTRFITCENIDALTKKKMLLTFQDRIRVSWCKGALKLSVDALVPFILLPMLLGLAAINIYCAVLVLLMSSTCVFLAYSRVKRKEKRTSFFFMWLLWSIIYMFLLFEFTAPVLELLPEEHWILIIISISAFLCFWRIKEKAQKNCVIHSSEQYSKDSSSIYPSNVTDKNVTINSYTTLLINNEDKKFVLSASQCGKCIKDEKHTTRCNLCSACILRHDHHSYWLDCCIGLKNHFYFLGAIFFAEIALLFGANLTLTAICHPFLVFRLFGLPFMLPDDCSEVFEEYKIPIVVT